MDVVLINQQWQATKGIWLTDSLAKFHLGSNIETLARESADAGQVYPCRIGRNHSPETGFLLGMGPTF